MEYVNIIVDVLANVLNWWLAILSADQTIFDLFVSVVFAGLLMHFIILPAMRIPAGSDEASKHPRKNKTSSKDGGS